MTDVKPCPFCGSSEFEIRERVMEGKKGYPVTLLHWCYHDRAHANKPIERVGNTREEAIAAWTKRA